MGYINELRKKVGHEPLLHTCASVIVVNDNNELLMQKRTDNGLWGYCGGAVELFETVEQSAERELYEESGLTAHSLELFGVYSGEEQHHIYPNGDEVWTIDIVYICRDFSGELACHDGESAELCFVPYHKIKDYPLNPPIRKPLNDFIDKYYGKEHL
ncbi:MAG: NUDIX domain-containing protein [Oscillospiraceae bacterium]|nr:NUDIX domain-containing protein [Oscillospiraceae bacterium]